MKHAVIIGAGPAGITAACTLMRHTDKYTVTILEKTNRVGGIACTVDHNGNRMDLGGHRFYSEDARVNAWWRSVLAEDAMLTRKRTSHIYYNRRYFPYPVTLGKELFQNLGFGETVAVGASYMAARLHKRQEHSLEDFYINRFGKKLYERFFKGYTEKVWGVPATAISPDWGKQRVRGLSVTAVLRDAWRKLRSRKKDSNTETSLIEAFLYPSYGPGQLWEKALADFRQMGGQVRMGCTVTNIEMKNGAVTGVTYAKDGILYTEKADILLSSMPLCDLVAGMTAVPDKIRAIASGLVYRDFVTVGVLLKKPVEHSDDCWLYIHDTDVSLGRIQNFNNWSPYMTADSAHTVWLGLEYFCTKGDDRWLQSDAAWAAQAVAELVKIGIISSEKVLLDFHVERVEKAYPAYWGTYTGMMELRTYLNSIENLYCIGRNGQHRYNNMDHAMLTAFAAVDAIENGNTTKEQIWSVNAE